MNNIQYLDRKRTTHINTKNGVVYITFEKLERPEIVHGFTTRYGGVSKGYLGTMNVSFHRGDIPENVMENHRRLGSAIGYDYNKLVFSDQIHETRIHKVTEEDMGKGIVRPSDIIGIDGLMTNVPGIPLMTFYADCVPIYFYDPVKKVVALNHSGWKGTVGKISAVMISRLHEEYGCEASDIICAIGPSICHSCYEVSEDVALQFKKAYSHEQYESMIEAKENGKYQLDLHRANYYNLTNAGVKPENIDITDICTCCNPNLLFSHRASHGNRGNLGAVIMLKA
jgi:hypothetical protein